MTVNKTKTIFKTTTMFGLIILLLSITVLFPKAFDEVFLNESNAVIDYADIINKTQFFIEKQHVTIMDKDSIILTSVKQLNSIKTGDFFGYLADVSDANGNKCYIVIDAYSGNVIEYAESNSPLYSNVLNKKSTTSYYYSPLNYWFSNSDGICINAMTGATTKVDSLILSANQKSVATNNITTSNQSVGYVAQSPTFNYILNVPDYQQANGYLCINTAILNIIAYWDNNGLPNLITGTINQARTDIQSALVAAGGSGANASIPGAINSYATLHGGYYSDVWNLWNPEFWRLQFEIDYGDPCLVGFPTYYGGGHMTTGVGYNTIDGVNYAIVHDNHSNTPYDVVIAFSEVDFIGSVSILDA